MVNQLLKFTSRKISYLLWKLFEPSKYVKMNSNAIKKILVVNLGFIGDLLATTPMISALKKKTQARITVLVRKGMQEVFEKNSEVNNILVYQNNFQKDLQQIRKGDFDLVAIVWPATYKVCSLCKKAGIPYRIGTTQVGLTEKKGYFLTRMVNPSIIEKHKVQENLDISRLINADIGNPRIKFSFSKQDDTFVKKFLKNKKKVVVIHPGKRGKFYSEYSWHVENFAKTADYLSEQHKATIVITGAKGEERIAKAIAKEMKTKPLIATDKLTLGQFAALLSKATHLISIDTAAIHIASAVNKEVIVINTKYPKIWHPWMDKKKYRLLLSPTVDEVVTASAAIIMKWEEQK